MISALSVPKRPQRKGSPKKELIFYNHYRWFLSYKETLEQVASLDIRIESEYAWDLTNHPNEYVQQIDQDLVTIDISEDANSYKKAFKGEILKLQSKIFFDYVIRKNWTDKWVLGLNLHNIILIGFVSYSELGELNFI